MRYIGCKKRLLPFIHQTIKEYKINGNNFCDLFSGTATVGQYFKQQGYRIISNDILYSSYIQQRVKICINTMPTFETLAHHLNIKSNTKSNTKNFAQLVMDYLNHLNGIEGFIYHHYSIGGTKDKAVTRLYYTDINAKKIDVIRETIQQWKNLRLINEDEFHVLLFTVLNEASDCANTTGGMNGFLKKFYSNALRPIRLKLPEIISSQYQHEAYCANALDLLKNLKSIDILYLDPPYTSKQYGAAYHLLETIAHWDHPDLYGAMGLRESKHLNSALCSKREAFNYLEKIVACRNYRHVLMSYSNKGIIPHEKIMRLFKQYGEVSYSSHSITRYNPNPKNPQDTKMPLRTEEQLYYLKPYGL